MSLITNWNRVLFCLENWSFWVIAWDVRRETWDALFSLARTSKSRDPLGPSLTRQSNRRLVLSQQIRPRAYNLKSSYWFLPFLPFVYFGEFSAAQKNFYLIKYSDTEINRRLSIWRCYTSRCENKTKVGLFLRVKGLTEKHEKDIRNSTVALNENIACKQNWCDRNWWRTLVHMTGYQSSCLTTKWFKLGTTFSARAYWKSSSTMHKHCMPWIIRSFNINISWKSTALGTISNQRYNKSLPQFNHSYRSQKLIISVRYILTGLPNSCITENDHLKRFIMILTHLPEECFTARHVLEFMRFQYQTSWCDATLFHCLCPPSKVLVRFTLKDCKRTRPLGPEVNRFALESVHIRAIRSKSIAGA